MFKRRIFPLVVASLAVALSLVSSASAETPCSSCRPWWHLSAGSAPSILSSGKEGEILLTAEDLGDAGLSSPVVVRDRLPAGFEAQNAAANGGLEGRVDFRFPYDGCVVEGAEAREVTCTFVPEASYLNMPYTSLSIAIKVKVAITARSSTQSGEENLASVAGGGASGVSVSRPVTVGSGPVPFGVEQYELTPENADGSVDTQAGSHPFQLTTTLALNQNIELNAPPALPKDLRFDWPPGLVGNPTPFPQCPLSKFVVAVAVGSIPGNLCPDDTVVGMASITYKAPVGYGGTSFNVSTVPVFALVPSVGEPARLGFMITKVPVYIDTAVRSGGDYGVTVTVPNITELTGVISSRVTIWGVPGDRRHDSVRGWNCLTPAEPGVAPCEATHQESPPPFLTMPTACTGPLHTSVEAESWQDEGSFTEPSQYTFTSNLGQPVGMDGCNELPFTPSIKVTPDGQAGSSPTGLTVDEHVPQETSLNPTGLAESDVKGLSVTLPEGVVLNPSAADGLQACSMEEIGLQSGEASTCPEAAKVATVKVKTPLLPNPLEGAAYLAAQDANPFGSLVALYVEAYDPVSGVRIKAAGEVLENPVTGQLTAHFEQDPVFADDPAYAGVIDAQYLPEAPFEDVELHFFGGDRAPLGTPALCGAYTTTGTFSPWSGGAPTPSSSTFDITSGPNGSACESPLPFGPSLAAGTTSIQAGGFSSFTNTITREDGQQAIQQIQLRMPPGLSGLLSGVELCGEAQANAGTCGPNSLIGETIVSVGLGGDPFSVTGGKVYITGPYHGAPFGLSIVNPAKAGPFNLGLVIVRAKIEVNPITAALTVTTNTEKEGYAIPHILDGIPLQIKHVNVTINRPGFTFNPTNCDPMSITGNVGSTEGATMPVSVPFQVTNCAVLSFKPGFAVSTFGKTSRANGASLNVKLTYPKAPFGSQANIKSVKVDLPKQLPSRLTTLQKACPAKTFEANPAGCPADSIVGHAIAITPLVPVSLTGPAYFVSYGGAKFPELVIVLQGYGVTLDLHGETFISKAGITSSTFHTIPDAPVGSFELTLPEGPFSALAANGSLCSSKLVMPTAFTAQNGMEIHESTKINVTDCPKHKTKKTKKAKKKPRRAGGHGKGAKEK